ncbi:glycosyltransferase family 4 protein [Prosthecomicrobium sp. N25]|uniref:glycosyltransferase family 4 protein n=1 Tax=Prosthecomicrobium sp. N25 TaxID=3129254 RepID=UPI003077B534
MTSVTPLSIALTIPTLSAGGAEKVISSMANYWAVQGHRVTIINLESNAAPPFHPLLPVVTVVGLGLGIRRRRRHEEVVKVLQRLVNLRRAISAAEPDVVIAFLTRMNVMTLLATRGLGIPVIVSERNNPREQDIHFIWNRLRSLLYRHASGVTALTQEALDFYPAPIRKKGAVIPNAFDAPPSQAERGGEKILVAVGRLVRQKGFDLLIQAYALAARDLPEWKLVIWGEGPERERLEALRDRLGLNDRIVLPGITPRPYSWIDDAHVFVLSSRFEGFANVVGEALSAGLPVIAFDCDWGPRQMVRPDVNGLLVPPQDVDALASALRELLPDRARQDRMARAARASMVAYSTHSVMAKWDEVIMRALARPPVRISTARMQGSVETEPVPQPDSALPLPAVRQGPEPRHEAAGRIAHGDGTGRESDRQGA